VLERRAVFETQTLALVSHCLPPGHDGFSIMLSELFGAIPEDRLATVGIALDRWGKRTHAPLLVPRKPSRTSESAVMAAVMVASQPFVPRVLTRLFPNVRRIVATLDPTVGAAVGWARASGADLWLYAIDQHASTFWGAGAFLRGPLETWCREAFGRASRTFAISPRMADWMRAHGSPGEIEILPPLIDVDRTAPAPLPEGRRSLLFCGWIYQAQGRSLAWLERAVTALAPEIELRLVTMMKPADVAAAGLDPARWSIVSVPASQVAAEIARATCTIVALDPEAKDRVSLQASWPTKLREYLSVGRPVLCIAAPDYGIVDIAARGGWALIADDEAGTREAVAALASSSDEDLWARAIAAHRFARERMNNRTIGANFRTEALRP
jgi:hypothetical protein